MLFMNNECAETDIQKANMLNNYFASQATIDDDKRPLPPVHQYNTTYLPSVSQFKMSRMCFVTLM